MRRIHLTAAQTLALVGLGLALAMRLWALGFGTHVPLARPDEESFLLGGFGYFGTHDPAYTLRTGWPLGFFHLSYFVEVLEHFFYRTPSGDPANLGCIFAMRPSAIYLGIRLVSALADVGTCLVVGLTARRLARREDADLALAFGIFAYAVNYLAAREAHNAMVNSTLALLVALVVLACVRAVQDSPAWLLAAGAISGASFGFKYSAAPLFFVCLSAGIGALLRFRSRGRTLAFGAFSIVAAFVAFEIVSPECLANFDAFKEGLSGIAGRYGPAFAGMIDLSWPHEPGWKFHFFTNLPLAFGWAGYLLAIAGLVIALRDRGWEASPVVGQAIAAAAMLAPLAQLFVRYALPIIPPLAVGLGVALARISGFARERSPDGLRNWLAAVGLSALAVLAFGPPLARLAQYDHLLAQPDTREVAQRWLLDHHATGGSYGYYQQIHLVEPSWKEACVGRIPSWVNPDEAANDPDHGPPFWNQLVNQGPSAFLQMSLDGAFKGQNIGEAEYVLWPAPILMCGKQGRTEGPEPSGQCFELAETISPGQPACHDLFDMFDSFFVPYAAFDGMTRPGPEVKIFKNLCRR